MEATISGLESFGIITKSGEPKGKEHGTLHGFYGL